MVKATGAGAGQKAPGKAPAVRLWVAAWNAPVVSLQALRQQTGDSAVVVPVHTAEEEEEVAQWLTALGSKRPVTIVRLDEAASGAEVLVESRLGPVKRKAALRHLGNEANAPKPRALAPDPKLDDDKSPEEDVTVMRMTFAKEFADAGLYDKANAKPQCLPGCLWPEMVLRGSSALWRRLATSPKSLV